MTKQATALDLLQRVSELLEYDKKWDGTNYSYNLVFPHQYLPLLEEINNYLKRTESLE